MSTDHNFWRERRAEAVSNRGPSAYQPTALPLGQTGSHGILIACQCGLWSPVVLSARAGVTTVCCLCRFWSPLWLSTHAGVTTVCCLRRFWCPLFLLSTDARSRSFVVCVVFEAPLCCLRILGVADAKGKVTCAENWGLKRVRTLTRARSTSVYGGRVVSSDNWAVTFHIKYIYIYVRRRYVKWKRLIS